MLQHNIIKTNETICKTLLAVNTPLLNIPSSTFSSFQSFVSSLPHGKVHNPHRVRQMKVVTHIFISPLNGSKLFIKQRQKRTNTYKRDTCSKVRQTINHISGQTGTDF